MKQNLFNKLWLRVGMIVAIMTTALSGTVKADEVTDVLTAASFAATSTTYTNFSGVSFTSDAVYAGNSAKTSNGGIQLRSRNSNSGIVSTTSGGKVKSVSITVEDGSNTVDVYGSNTAYTAASDLYGNNQGTKLGSLSANSTTVTVEGDYAYVGIRSNNGAIYLTNITIVWEVAGGSTPTCATPTFSPAAGTYTSVQNVTLSTETADATIYYTTDGSDPTASSSVYSSAIPVSSTTTIKAMAAKAGMDNSSVASATYTIVSLEHAGTEADPYTVADARNAIDAGVGCTGVYVAGKVSHINGYYSSKYITYWISDDGTSQDLEAYNGLGLNGAEFSSKDDLQEGDAVVIYGDLTKYNSTYEFSSGNYLVSHTSSSTQVAAGLSYSATTATADLADLTSFTAPTLSNPHSLPISYESSNTDVATVASDGTVTPLAKGTTTITATSEETSEYFAGEASYTLTVTNSNAALVTVDADGNTIFDFTDNAWGFPTSKQLDEGSYSNSGYTVKVAGAGSGNGFYFFESGSDLLFGKSGAYLTLPAFDYDVEKIVVVGKAGASTSVVQNIYVGDEAVSTATTGATGTNTYMIAEAYKAAGNVYTLKVTSAHNTQITSIKVYKAAPDNRTPVTLTFTGVPATIVKDETATYAVTASPAVTGITYSSSDEDVVMVDENTGEIGALALGTATITATFAGDDDYKPATASYKIEVVAPKHTVTFFVNGVEQTDDEAEVSEGAAITFPATPADVNGKTFMGWTTEEISGTTDTAPTIVTSATMGTADVTYYAVFATQEGTGSTTTVTDVLTRETTDVTGNSYSDWSETGTSGAEYAGNSAGGNESIQLRSNNNNSGIVTTTSGGKVKKVTVTWNSNTQNDRTLNVYGSNTAYTAATDLYGDNAGTLVGTIVYGTSTELTINDDYTFVGLRSASGAMYLTSISIDWETGTGASYSGYCTTVAPVSQSVTVTPAGYATIVAKADLEIPEKVEVYAVTVGEGASSAQLIAVTGGVPAGNAVLVKASADTYEFPYASATPDAIAKNDLHASDGTVTGAAGNIFALAKKTNGVGFYKVGEDVTIPAGKAYLEVTITPSDPESGVKSFYGFEDDATGIEAIDHSPLTIEGAVYNLAGQRLQKMQKGINIVNGKKIAVK